MSQSDLHKIAEATNHVGAKIAIICNGELVTYLRDDFEHIPDPGLWDFPGGEREPGETAIGCALRETEEEFGIVLAPSQIIHAASYKSHQPGRADVAFFVAEVSRDMIASIRFGSEGQCWQMMDVTAFLEHRGAVKELQGALRAWCDGA